MIIRDTVERTYQIWNNLWGLGFVCETVERTYQIWNSLRYIGFVCNAVEHTYQIWIPFESLTSVGLAQARPNHFNCQSFFWPIALNKEFCVLSPILIRIMNSWCPTDGIVMKPRSSYPFICDFRCQDIKPRQDGEVPGTRYVLGWVDTYLFKKCLKEHHFSTFFQSTSACPYSSWHFSILAHYWSY